MSEPGTFFAVSLAAPKACPECGGRWTRQAQVALEAVFTDDGEIRGLAGVLRFNECGHLIPDGIVDATAVANLLEAIEEEDSG